MLVRSNSRGVLAGGPVKSMILHYDFHTSCKCVLVYTNYTVCSMLQYILYILYTTPCESTVGTHLAWTSEESRDFRVESTAVLLVTLYLIN